MLRLRLDVRLALLCIKTLKSNSVRSTRFWNNLHQVRYWNNLHQVRYWNNLHQVRYWNNLHQVRTVKRLECKLFKCLKGLNLVANIGYD